MISAAGRPTTREHVVAELSSHGLHFRTFSIEHDSPHAIGDWDWNQRDLAHVPFVHGGFRFAPVLTDDERAVGFYVQRIFGVRMPLLVCFAHPTPTSRLYETAIGPLVLVIEAALTPLASGTRVRTTYSIGSPRWMRAALPIAERFLRANYTRIHDEDEPIRARRRQLRAWGYRFASDDGAASYRRSLDLGSANVVAPPHDVASDEAIIDVDDGAREWRIGRDDHLGLRVVRNGRELRVLPRMCIHEGASLDACDAAREVVCPWHGRRIKPLCTFEIGASTREERTAHHRVVLEGAMLRASRIR